MSEMLNAIDLQRFGEGGGDGGAQGVGGPVPGDQGSNAAAPGGEGKVSFKDFLKQNPDYKREHDGAVKSAVTQRISGLKGQLEAHQKITDLLAARYGMDLDANGGYDLAALLDKVTNDRSGLSESAMEHGVTPEEEDTRLRDQMLLKRYKANEARQAQDEARRQAAFRIGQEADAMAQKYPGFNMDAEMQNQEFRKMVLQDNVPVEKAYRFVHMDDMMADAMRYASGQAMDQVTATVAAGRGRPTEGAARSNGAGVSTTKSFTPKDIAEVKKMMAKGIRVGQDW